MIKKKVILVLITAMIMTGSLTACQKTEGETENNTGQTEETGEEGIDKTTDITAEEADVSATEQETSETTPQEQDASLEFLANSPEYQACAEWEDFYEGYDTDLAILEQVGNEPVEAGYEYEAYSCYSPEMEEKIDEICEKYDLSKLSGFQIADDYDDLCSKTGVGDFCIRASENVKQTVLVSYLYDGVFLMDGNAILAGSSFNEVSYQFARVVKGYFTSAYLNLGDLTTYDVQEYTTKKGEKVFFADRADKNVHIIVEREKSFIVINVLEDLSDISDTSNEWLEQLADAFDFAAIP